jgi:hypothetical protein
MTFRVFLQIFLCPPPGLMLPGEGQSLVSNLFSSGFFKALQAREACPYHVLELHH